MNVNAEPDKMIDNGIEDPADPALSIGQTGELAIRVIENVRDYLQKQPSQVYQKRLIEIKMTGDDSEHSADQGDGRRAKIQLCKKIREIKAGSSIKQQINHPFDLARLVGRFDCRGSL